MESVKQPASPAVPNPVHHDNEFSAFSALPLEPFTSIFENYLVYETSSYFYIVAYNEQRTVYRLLKLDRTIVKPQLLADIVIEDPNVYDKKSLMAMLDMINEGNKSTGGLVKVTTAVGIVGFVRFFDQFYLTVITQRKKVATVGNNVIYTIKGTETIAIKPREESEGKFFHSMWSKLNKKLNQTPIDVAESRYFGLFQFIDMTKDFYFSYSYDITHSLQYNYTTQSCKLFPSPPANEMFEWNKYQTQELTGILSRDLLSNIILPIIHGSVQQRQFSIFGRQFDLCLLARRSRHYAGTRYLKRGISVHGKVANDVEIEQILQLDTGVNASFASFLQVRGSIPTYWYQETSVTNPKPPILINRVDPKYLATQEHFSDLMCRYGAPIIVLDLVKQSEKRKRECLVGAEFKEAVHVLNDRMPMEAQIRYIALDFSRISSSKSFVSRHATVATGNASATSTSVLSPMPASAHGYSSPMPATSTGTPGLPGSQIHSPFKSAGLHSPAPPTGSGGSSKVTTCSVPVGAGMKDVLDTSTVSGRLDVLRELDDLASYSMKETDMFCTNVKYLHTLSHLSEDQRVRIQKNKYMQQHGAVRTNCIDCLDRTNVAQFALGVRFLTNALKCLGVCRETDGLASINVVLKVFMGMFAHMGNKISLQYGGSEAHNKMRGNAGSSGQTSGGTDTAMAAVTTSTSGNSSRNKSSAETGAKRSKGGELLTSVKRYYSNSFTDRLKQDAMNLFLGCYVPSLHHYQSLSAEGSSPSATTNNPKAAQEALEGSSGSHGTFLWDLDSDYFLHNKNLRPPQPLSDLIYFRAEQGIVPESVKKLIANKCNHGEMIQSDEDGAGAGVVTAFEVPIGDTMVSVSLLSLANYFFSQQYVGKRVSRTIDNSIDDYAVSVSGGSRSPHGGGSGRTRGRERGSMDVSELIHLANQLPDKVKCSIARAELRKRKQKAMIAYADVADQQWWKLAISRFEDFYLRDRGLACPDDTSSPFNVMAMAGYQLQHGYKWMKPYYERQYDVGSLTTFDSVFEDESEMPISIAVSSMDEGGGMSGFRPSAALDIGGAGDHVRTTETGAPSLHNHSVVPGGGTGSGRTNSVASRSHAGSDDADGGFGLGAYFNVVSETMQGVVASVAGVAGFLPTGSDREAVPSQAVAGGRTDRSGSGARKGVVSADASKQSSSRLKSHGSSFYDMSLFSLVDSDPLHGDRCSDVESIYCDYVSAAPATGVDRTRRNSGGSGKNVCVDENQGGRGDLAGIAESVAIAVQVGRSDVFNANTTATARAAAMTAAKAAVAAALEAENEKRAEYDSLYKDCRIDINDVQGMEGLAADANTNMILTRGLYKGMKQSVSSTVAQEHLMYALMIVENDLRRCVDGASYTSAYFKSNSTQVKEDAVPVSHAHGVEEDEEPERCGSTRRPQWLSSADPADADANDDTDNSLSPNKTPFFAVLDEVEGKASRVGVAATAAVNSADSPKKLTRRGSGIKSALLYGPSTGTSGDGNAKVSARTSLQTPVSKARTVATTINEVDVARANESELSGITVDIPPSARLALERFILHHRGSGTSTEADSGSVQKGMEPELYNTVFNYLLQQALYAKGMNYERLCTRCSQFTSDQVLLDYMSLYESDALASNLELIQYLRADRDQDSLETNVGGGSNSKEECEERFQQLHTDVLRHLQDKAEVVKSKEWKDILVAQLQFQQQQRQAVAGTDAVSGVKKIVGGGGKIKARVRAPHRRSIHRVNSNNDRASPTRMLLVGETAGVAVGGSTRRPSGTVSTAGTSSPARSGSKKSSSTRKKVLKVLKKISGLSVFGGKRTTTVGSGSSACAVGDGDGKPSAVSGVEEEDKEGDEGADGGEVYISSSSESDEDEGEQSGSAVPSRRNSSNRFERTSRGPSVVFPSAPCSSPERISTINNTMDYVGFYTDTYDCYTGMHNPYLRVNEATAKAYTSYLHNITEPASTLM